MNKKLKAVIIGPGNIGTDLLMKMQRSEWIEPVWMVGIDQTSEGLKRAAEMGIKTTAEGVDGMLAQVIAYDFSRERRGPGLHAFDFKADNTGNPGLPPCLRPELRRLAGQKVEDGHGKQRGA